MTNPKLFVFSIVLASLFVIITPQKSPIEPEDAISSLRIELEKLKTKVSILESTIEKSDNKLKIQDDGIKQMENIILEKSQSIATLQNEIEDFQLHKVSNEQKIGNHMAEEAPQVTEEEMMKAKSAATFMKSPKEWIPVMKDQWFPFVSSLGSHFQPLTVKIIEAYHVTENLLLSNKAKIQTSVSPFIQEWLPIMKDQWLTFIYSLCSHFKSLTAKIIEACRVTTNSLLSYKVKIQTSTAPFIRASSGKSVWACRILVTSIISYHNQVEQCLKTSKLARSLASIELAWFAATALLCLPVVCLCRFYSAIFSRKRGRKLRRTYSNSIRHKLKRPLDID